MNNQDKVDQINETKQRMLRNHHSNVVAFARKTLMRRADGQALLAEFDRLRGNAKLERAMELVELWVPQLDNRLVPSVMESSSVDVRREIARQKAVFEYVMDHYLDTKEVLSGMPIQLLEGQLDREEAEQAARIRRDAELCQIREDELNSDPNIYTGTLEMTIHW